MKLFDVHCHLQDKRYAGRLPVVIGKACAAGIEKMLCCGCEESDWEAVRKLAGQYKAVLPSFGLHPLYLKPRSPGWLDALKTFLKSVPSAVGEIGLDHAVEPRDDKDQEKVFAAQLHLARELERPVTLHCRKAWGRLLEILRYAGGLRCGGIIHSYSGAPELIRPLEEMGLSISFSGALTRFGNKRGRRAIRFVMKERLMLETDSPDLTPVGAPSACNEPANLTIVVREAAALLRKPVEEIAEQTYRNAERLFSFSPAASLAAQRTMS